MNAIDVHASVYVTQYDAQAIIVNVLKQCEEYDIPLKSKGEYDLNDFFIEDGYHRIMNHHVTTGLDNEYIILKRFDKVCGILYKHDNDIFTLFIDTKSTGANEIELHAMYQGQRLTWLIMGDVVATTDGLNLHCIFHNRKTWWGYKDENGIEPEHAEDTISFFQWGIFENEDDYRERIKPMFTITMAQNILAPCKGDWWDVGNDFESNDDFVNSYILALKNMYPDVYAICLFNR